MANSMKDLFPGHFKESEESLRKIWESALFVFDANILLNFYRYSDTTRGDFFQLLQKISGRIWLPHRAAEEYFNNRSSVIKKQSDSYDEALKGIKLLEAALGNARHHPFVEQKTLEDVNSTFFKLNSELKQKKDSLLLKISSDDIKEEISAVFGQKIGSPFSKEKLEELFNEGQERYKQKIPPGYKDSNKSGDNGIFSAQCKKYGDYIVWTQLI